MGLEVATAGSGGDLAMSLRHLRRDTRTALELAIVAGAPVELVDMLASSSGLLEALADLPIDAPSLATTVTRAVARSQEALRRWERWRELQVGLGAPT